jgi:hypothetical protein
VARRNVAAVATLVALACVDAGCGSDDGGSRPVTTPSSTERPPTVEAEPRPKGSYSEGGRDGSSGKQGSSKSKGESSGRNESGRGSYDPDRPDEPGNDKPPPPGSPAERFEQACKKDPHLCN